MVSCVRLGKAHIKKRCVCNRCASLARFDVDHASLTFDVDHASRGSTIGQLSRLESSAGTHPSTDVP
jgi:hypothetical protein